MDSGKGSEKDVLDMSSHRARADFLERVSLSVHDLPFLETLRLELVVVDRNALDESRVESTQLGVEVLHAEAFAVLVRDVEGDASFVRAAPQG
jgi:hypothetical protein